MRCRSALHVIPSVAARDGGPSAAVVGMCRSLIATGLKVEIATTDADGDGRLPVPLGTTTEHDGVPTTFFARKVSTSFKWSPALSAWLRAHVSAYDVVHVHAVFSHASIAAGRACARAGVPYVLRPLGTLDPWSVGRHAWRKQALLMAGVSRLLSRAAAVQYTTDGEWRLAEAGFPKLARGVVVPVGIDDRYFGVQRGARGASPFVALVLSRLDPKKRVEWVVEAWHELTSQAPGLAAQLVIAGDGDRTYVDELRRLASAGPAADRIRFAGWVSGEQKLALLASADLVVAPSHQENFGIAIVEAMAAGVPAMVTPGVNLGTAIDAAGAGWVVADDRRALRSALEGAVADVDREARCRRARMFAERFRWTSVARQMSDLYESILESRAPAGVGVAAAAGIR